MNLAPASDTLPAFRESNPVDVTPLHHLHLGCKKPFGFTPTKLFSSLPRMAISTPYDALENLRGDACKPILTINHFTDC
jgi:hypothetical protein